MINLVFSPVQERLMRPHGAIRCVRVPSDLVLTPRVLLGVLRTLQTTDIQNVVDSLIDELDARCGDIDLEADSDECIELELDESLVE
jgi:hypothetical protein